MHNSPGNRAALPLSAGQMLGHYRIEAEIGAGGMGVVYRALDTRLNRNVAIKVLPPQFVTDPERRARLEREARALATLNHHNIASIYGLETIDGSWFLVLELCPGETLDRHMAGNRPDTREALGIAIQVAEGVEAAHERGVIHRDLKPSNIMVAPNGTVKILDFGLAKPFMEASATTPPNDTETETLADSTATRAVLGTPAYMSPEQARGKPVDKRTDIWSFGCVLYELLARRRPFGGETASDRMAAVLEREPDWKALPAAVPETVIRLIRRCLEKDVTKRLRDIGDARLELEDALAGIGVPRPAGGELRKTRWAFAAAGMALVLTVSAGLWLFARRDSRQETTGVMRQLTHDAGLTTDPAISPDGKLVAYASDRGSDHLNIWLQQADGDAQPVQLTHLSGDAHELHFSPDGSKIVFRAESDGGGLFVIPTIGGTPVPLGVSGRDPRFSPDGKWIAYWTGYIWVSSATGGDAIGRSWVVPSSGGEAREVTGTLGSAAYPVWSPDGKHLLVFVQMSFPQRDWCVIDLESGKARQTGAFAALKAAGSLQTWTADQPRAMQWSRDFLMFSIPTGDTVNIWRARISSSGKISEPFSRATAGPSIDTNASEANGRIAFASLQRSDSIWFALLSAGGKRIASGPAKLTDSTATESAPSISRDGRFVVYTAMTPANKNDVFLKDTATGDMRALVSNPGDEQHAVISPDGSVVAFQRDRRLYAVPARGGVPKVVGDDFMFPWSWSSDNRRLLAIRNPGETQAWAIDVASGKVSRFAVHDRFQLYQLQLTRAQDWTVLEAVEDQVSRVFVAPVRDGIAANQSDWIPVGDDRGWEDKPRWSVDERTVYYISERDGHRCLWARDVDPTTKHPTGPPVGVWHSHLARLSLNNIGVGILELGVAADRVVFDLGELKGNVWIADGMQR